MIYHVAAFFLGFILDLLLGDPHFIYHPVRIIGNLIAFVEKRLNRTDYSDNRRRNNGRILVFVVIASTGIVTAGILIIAYLINIYAGIVVEAIMTYQILAIKSLKDESMKVYYALKTEDLQASRQAVSMIVGRDTMELTQEGVAKAAVETVAENTSDGIIAPMIYTAIGGPVLGYVYKSINTMDSMVGYKNDRYMNFGRAAAKLDDIVNYIPARVSAVIMIAAAGILSFFSKKYDAKRAARIFKRDRYNHASPNSAQTEAVCAGALGLRLAGDASYFGKIVKKPYIGDEIRKIEKEDIVRANKLLYVSAFICELLCVIILGVVLI